MSLIRITCLLLLLLTPEIALAHSPIKGIGFLLNGILHPFLVPAQVLIVLALGLLYGQHKLVNIKTSVLIFLLATIVGLITSAYSISIDVSLLLLVGATVIGLIVISHLALHPFLYSLLGLSVGFIVGLDSTPEGLSPKQAILSLFGSGAGIYFMLLYAMALSESMSRKPWQIIAVRVIASWLSASAMMVLALSFSR